MERWLAGGRRNLTVAFLAASLSMLSKEAGLGLPLLFLAFMWAGIGVRLKDKAFAWALVMFLLLAVAVVEGVLVYTISPRPKAPTPWEERSVPPISASSAGG